MTVCVADLISLEDSRALDPVAVGTKAATLARLGRDGFPVPKGVVIPAAVLANAQEQDLAALAGTVTGLLGEGPWAVRSSGVSEDQAERSFAGQFVTTLNVTTSDLATAVLRTHRSALAEHARVYGGDVADSAGIPVLVQPMVNAQAAGVAFTVDPVTGAEVTTVEAVAGLGESLVSGSVDPERWRIEDGKLVAPVSPSVLNEDEVREVADTARRVESLLGSPQDIEWAIAANHVVLLQARPVTTAIGPELIPIEVEVPPGTWFTDAAHQPRPPMPITYYFFDEPTLPQALAEFGVLVDDVKFQLIGGWMYMQIQPTGAPPPKEGGSTWTPPSWLLALGMRLHPAVRRRAKAARIAIQSDLSGTYLK